MPRTAGARSRRKLNKKSNKKKLDEHENESETENASHKSDSEPPKQEPEQSEEPEYFPERIVDHRITNGEKEYYVKWKDWSSDDNTWEPQNHLSTVPKLVESYEQSLQKKPQNAPEKSVSVESQSPSLSPKIRKIRKISSLTASDEESKSPQFITKRQKRKSFANKNTFSGDDADYEPVAEKNEQEKSVVEQNEQEKSVESDGNASESEEPTYTVESIVKHRKSVKQRYAKTREDGERCMEYYVKWKDWDSSTNTWEHETELTKCTKLIDAYWEKKKQKKNEIDAIVNKKKVKKKRHKARRTNICCDDFEINENNENDVSVNKSRKRKLSDDDNACDDEPPSKKRRIDKTVKVIMDHGGLDAFLQVLDDGDQDTLSSMVEKYEKSD